MQGSQAFAGSYLNNATANNNSFNNNPSGVMVQGSITSLEINNFYVSDPSSAAINDPTKGVNFAEPPSQPGEGIAMQQVLRYLPRLVVRDAHGRTSPLEGLGEDSRTKPMNSGTIERGEAQTLYSIPPLRAPYFIGRKSLYYLLQGLFDSATPILGSDGHWTSLE